jgi:ABC-type nitrate/sulfonate/bicarbonate transport system ATPase subunit
VARAVAVSPQLLLLDEPFGALDALTRARLQTQLLELWADDACTTETVLMVTHGIDEAILLADRVVVMANPPVPSVRAVIEVPIARPRDRVSITEDPAYAGVQQEVMTILAEDGLAAA